jgi:phospholipase/carboxylesterase
MSELTFLERPAAGEPAGLLVLHHGRGTDEHDLLPLGDVLDPGRRLHVAAPRGPLTLAGWPGHPDLYACATVALSKRSGAPG